ncbi:TPA: brain acid soluble protein 1 [Streptococcus suis]|nr:brain acid soluble protein 1 [Streptococcus suis]
MKRKERIRRAKLHKWTRLGVSLAAVTVLGGVATAPNSFPFVNDKVVYAEEDNTSVTITVEAVEEGTLTPLGTYGTQTVNRDGSITITAPEVDGYEFVMGFVDNGSWPVGYAEGTVLTVDGSAFHETEKAGTARFFYRKIDTTGLRRTYKVEWYLDGQYYDGYTTNIEPGELHDRGIADKGGIPIWHDFAERAENSPWNYKITYEKVAAGENYYRFDLVSKDKATVPYTIELVDQDGQVLQTIQQSGVEGTEVTFDFPVISGYRAGMKVEGFDRWSAMRGGTFKIVANKTVKVYYDKAPSIDSLIRPEQRVEYQKVFDEYHTTILKAFEVYKKELGVDDITYEANDLEKIFADSNLSVLHSELVLVEPHLFAEPVGLVLTDQDIINVVGWTPEYWDYQIAHHKEITQKLEKALANIAASKATTTVPVDQPITIKAVYTEEQIEPGQKVDVLKEIEYTLNPGESIVLEPLTFEGWTSRAAHERQTVTYEDAKNSLSKSYTFYYLKDYTIPTDKQVEQPVEIPTETPNEQPVEQPVETPAETPSETPANSPAETPTNVQPSADQVGQSATEPTVLSKQDSQAGAASPTGQSEPDKQETKQETKEPAAPASQSKQSTDKPVPTSQPQAKTLPATGEAHSVWHLTGLGLLGLAGLVVKRRSRKSS